jgi:hypothetical protein
LDNKTKTGLQNYSALGNAISECLNFRIFIEKFTQTSCPPPIPSAPHIGAYVFQKASYSKFYWKPCIFSKIE